jgi:muramoyltetrapeptide carboxypeptidase
LKGSRLIVVIYRIREGDAMGFSKKLRKGAIIGLVAPSSPITHQQLAKCRQVLEGYGFKVKAADNLIQSKGGYLAGPDKVRGEWINRMFEDDKIDAIFCVRGGDGGNRILEHIDKDIVRANKKIFVGYSDITSLHLLFNQSCGMITFHGPMVKSNMIDSFDKESQRAFFKALSGKSKYVYTPPKGFRIKTAREGSATGILTGGNLTVICSSMGTPYEINTEGKILFIEEVGERIGKIDRYIYQLRNSGKFKDLAGILLGRFENCEIEDESYNLVDVIMDATEDLKIPIMYNIQSGHGAPNITLPMGAACTMNTAKDKVEFSLE